MSSYLKKSFGVVFLTTLALYAVMSLFTGSIQGDAFIDERYSPEYPGGEMGHLYAVREVESYNMTSYFVAPEYSKYIEVDPRCADGSSLSAQYYFKDIFSVSWYNYYASALMNCGAIDMTDNSFRPWDKATRSEFLSLILKVNGIDHHRDEIMKRTDPLPFEDVDTEANYYNDVAVAYQLGIINGVSDNMFNPEGFITREEAVKMVLNAAGFNPTTYLGTSTFKDTDRTRWSEPYMAFVDDYGIADGSGNKMFHPYANMNRAEMVKFAVKMAQLDKKWFK